MANMSKRGVLCSIKEYSSPSSNTVQSSNWVLSHYCPCWCDTKGANNIYRCKLKMSDGAIMRYCSSVPPAWKHPERYYQPMVVECFSISLYCLGRRNVCRLKFWHMGRGIVLC